MPDDPGLSSHELRRRFAWARRQGRPAWLWPEVPIPAWRAAMDEVARVTATMLRGASGATIQGQGEAIALAGYTSGTGPLLGLWLEQGRLEADVAIGAVLDRHLAHNRVRNARLIAVATEMVGELALAGLDVLVLKGAHTGAAYFPELGVRPASDIDLLVRAGDVARAEAVLASAGLVLKRRGPWESDWHPRSGPIDPVSLTHVHADDPWSVDLHSSLNVWAGAGTPVAALDLGRPLDRGRLWGPDRRGQVLSQPLLLLHLAAHAGAGWHNLTLLRQVELVLVIRQDFEAGLLSWSEVLDLGLRTGALGYAYPALRLCEMLAPGTVPRQVLDQCAAQASDAVRRAMAPLSPANAQRIDRASLSEHFMWASGWRGRLRQLADDLVPAMGCWPGFLRVYEERAWRIIRGRVSQ